VNAEPRPAPPLADPETLVTSGEERTPHGPLWVARATYPDRYRHGRAHLGRARDFAAADLALVTRERRAQAVAPGGWLALDVESTGLGARAGTYAFLVGVGMWVADDFVVEQLLMRDPSDEPALLHALTERLARAAGILTFNGKAFDLPLLATRCALAKRPAAHAALVHCDVLHAARRIWRGGTGDCRLGALERRLLGLRRSHDVAGRDVPDLYLEYLRGGTANSIDAVLRHNRADLVSLALLAAEAARFLERARTTPPPDGEGATDRLRAARLYADSGAELEAAALFATCLGPGAPRPTRQAARAWLARARARAGDAAGACALWQAMLAEEPDLVEPYQALAKTYEHRVRDPARALAWVDERLARAPLAATDAAELAHRRARLARKLGGMPQRIRMPMTGDGATSGFLPPPSLYDGSRTLLSWPSPSGSGAGHPQAPSGG
jgi:hypothetical protein